MNITQAIEIITPLQHKRANGLLELVTEYVNGRDENGFNPKFGLVENQAFRVFIHQAVEFFAPVGE
jgi:hypothetical protein